MTNKLYYRKDFEISINNEQYKLTCFTQNTRTGFRHLCFYTSTNQGDYLNTRGCIAKCVYYNRTWEEYCYQSVLRKAVDKILHNLIYDMTCKAMKTVREVIS